MSLDHHFAEPTAIRSNLGAIFVSLELSRSTWLITSLSPGGGEKMSKHGLSAGNIAALLARLSELKQKAFARTGQSFQVIVIQEAGLDGFWIYRVLQSEGVESHVVDAASIAISRRRRRAKTDRVDGEAQLFWRASEPDRASGISQFRSDRFAIMRPFALAQPRLWVAQLLGGPSIGLLCRHDRPCDTSGLVCQGDGGDVEMPPPQKPGEPGALHLTAPHASHGRPSAMNE